MCYFKNYTIFISDTVQLVEDLEVNTVFEKILSVVEKLKKINFYFLMVILCTKQKNKIEKLNIRAKQTNKKVIPPFRACLYHQCLNNLCTFHSRLEMD